MQFHRTNVGSVVMTTLLFGAAAVVIGASVHTLNAHPAIDSAPTSKSASIQPTNHWVDSMTAPHKQFFDAPQPEGGIPLVHVMNYYETLNKAFSVKDADINAVLTFYGGTTFYGLNDAAWAKYKIGEFLGVKDATGAFATANPWRANPTILGMSLPQASIEGLKKRGATFILCNNALGLFSGMLAQKRGLDPMAVHEDMKANILPGVELIPGMVVAIEQAHKAGLSYHRQ
jgi:hypothetical protein